MAKDSQNEIPERVPEEDDDNKLLIYDANNGYWFRAREADVYKAVIHVNDLLVDRGTASVKDFYKILKCDPPAGSNIRGWYTWSDEWFNKHDGKVTLNFEMSAGYKTEDGLYYAIFCFYDDPMYHTELGASMDQCLEERRTLFHMNEAELDEYRNHE